VGKHKLKLWLRRAYAAFLYHSGLHALVDRAMPRRLTILFGHCVADPAVNGFLPADMKIGAGRLEQLLGWFARRYDMVTIGEGLALLGQGGRRSLVALSMDDGYRDNRTGLLPILARTGARATVFLETRPLDGGDLNWSHKLFWLLHQGEGIEALARRYAELAGDEKTRAGLARALAGDGDRVYLVKRVLKYDADPDDRERVIDQLFRARGGDAAALTRALYLGWDDARALRDAGVELGGHTVHHHVLAGLPRARQAEEIRGCATAMERAFGERPAVFAYPFGRRWDYDAASVEEARAAGFAAAVNTHAGTNAGGGFELRRLPIDDGVRLPLLVAEACGGFDLLRRLGIDLSE
jgi:peptidoglycan/xylan/chitin deacetylase (PgdA/CDA1 family)